MVVNQGVFPVQNSQIAHSTLAAGMEKWSVLKKGPTESISSSLAASAPPARVSRTIVAGASGSRVVTLGRNSSISYDSREHRYVNNGNPSATSTNEVRTEATTHSNGTQPASNASTSGVILGTTATHVPARTGTPGSPTVPQAPASASARAGTPPRAPAVPAPARSAGSAGSGSSFPSGGGTSWGGGSRSGGGSSGASSGSSGHPSATGGGGGGHPH